MTDQHQPHPNQQPPNQYPPAQQPQMQPPSVQPPQVQPQAYQPQQVMVPPKPASSGQVFAPAPAPGYQHTSQYPSSGTFSGQPQTSNDLVAQVGMDKLYPTPSPEHTFEGNPQFYQQQGYQPQAYQPQQYQQQQQLPYQQQGQQQPYQQQGQQQPYQQQGQQPSQSYQQQMQQHYQQGAQGQPPYPQQPQQMQQPVLPVQPAQPQPYQQQAQQPYQQPTSQQPYQQGTPSYPFPQQPANQQAPYQQQPWQQGTQLPVKNSYITFLVLSILSIVFCGGVFAIPALVYANIMNKAYLHGDAVGYEKAKNTSRVWLIVAVCIGLIANILYAMVIFEAL